MSTSCDFNSCCYTNGIFQENQEELETNFTCRNKALIPILTLFPVHIVLTSIAEKCFDVWGVLKIASVKCVEPGNNCFGISHIIRCRSKFLLLEFSKFFLVLIL